MRRREGSSSRESSSMLFCLFVLTCIASSEASEKTFLKTSASSALLFKALVIRKPSLQKCALMCQLEKTKCDGFKMETSSSSLCKLYEKVCYVGSGGQSYFGRKESVADSKTIRNLALDKPASESSTYSSYFASYGNDGNDDQFFHTLPGVGPWWRVDMLQTACVNSVYFMNRGHLSNRAKNIVVTVSLLEEDIMDTGDNRCGYIDGEALQWDNLVRCGMPLAGRYVQLQILDESTLHLREVEVNGF